jgi:phosphotransacetylase
MANNKKLTLKEKQALPLNEDLKIRVLNAKKALPKSGITSFFLQLNPEFDNVKGRSLLNNVLQSRSTDERITERLERLVEVMQKEVIDAETVKP